MTEISLHILDILQNSFTAGATCISVGVTENWDEDLLTIRISDNGRGMDEETVLKTADPFFTSRTTRKVGMGIPLLRQHAEMSGGSTTITSVPKYGTSVEAAFRLDHPDRQPLGDLAGTLVMMMSANPDKEVEFSYTTPLGNFSISHSEIREMLQLDAIRGHALTEQLTNLILNNMEALEFRA